MSVISGEGKKDFIIARRLLDEDEDIVTLKPVYIIAGAPEDTEVAEIKEILEKSGDYNANSWREYRVIPDNQWEAETKWAYEVDGDIRAWAIELCNEEGVASCVHEPGRHGTTYDELTGRFYDEKRITLRLPWGLHVALSRAANGTSLNSFCIGTLAASVGYSDMVDEFEAQRRKPGRPKKVQDSE